MNSRKRLSQAAKAAPQSGVKTHCYEVTVQQLIYVEAANEDHARELVQENPAQVAVGGCVDYKGQIALFQLKTADQVEIIKIVEVKNEHN